MNFEALERSCVVAAEMVGAYVGEAGSCTLITSLYLDSRLLFIYIPLYPRVCLIKSEPRACQLFIGKVVVRLEISLLVLPIFFEKSAAKCRRLFHIERGVYNKNLFAEQAFYHVAFVT